MRLAMSNIAWPIGEDDAAARILIEQGAAGVELAPTKVWPQPLEATARQRKECRSYWEKRGLEIVAFQSLIYGRPELTVFGERGARRRTAEYLRGIIDLAADMGAGVLVFGSPKNRRTGSLDPQEISNIAVPFFRQLGDYAFLQRVCLCIEPNPVEYGCDWITSAAPAIELAELVDSPGFGVHFDAAALTLAGDPVEAAFHDGYDDWHHFHASEPFLAPVGQPPSEQPGRQVDHARMARAMSAAGYGGWVSIEMKQVPDDQPWTAAMATALSYVRGTYQAAQVERARAA